MSSLEPARESGLRAAWEVGRAAWPALELDADRFLAWIGPRLDSALDPAQLVAADLYLATACVLRVAGAAEAFVKGPLAATERHVASIVKSSEARAELLQDLSVLLLAPGVDGSEPRLAQYSGRGPLAVWLRMTATRRALNLGRGKTKHIEFDEVAFERVADADPELSTLRRRHKQEIGAIFREATLATPREDRILLRLHYVQGSTMNELATLFRTSRSSLHRRIDAIRDDLMKRIAILVRQRLRIDTSQQDSMLRLFQSDLRDNLRQLLGDESAGEPR